MLCPSGGREMPLLRLQKPCKTAGRRARARVGCAFIEANAETLDGFFPPLPSPLPEAGALDEGRKLVLFLIAVRSSHVGAGRCGAGTGVRLEVVWMIVQHERSELNLRFRAQ